MEIRMPSRTKLIVIAAAATVAVLVFWTWSRVRASEPKGNGKQAPSVPVKTAVAETKTIPMQLRAIGQVEASSTVDVHPQVGGQLTRIAFKEGDFVNRGDVLFGIDPRVSQTDVAQAEANYQRAIATQKQAESNLAKDQAIAKTAQVEARRYASLVESGVVSRSQYDQVRTNAEAAAATVQADRDAVNSERKAAAAMQAAVQATKVQLSFTTITAPVSGKTGALMAHPGALGAPVCEYGVS
jgi:multidrug efflux system membrane fusion protein